MANRVCILTPPGAGAIAVIRLRGERVLAFSEAHLSRRPRIGACVHANLSDAAGTVIDDPVGVLIDEQTLDLSVHGGTWVVQRTLDLIRAAGFEWVQTMDPPEPTLESEMLQALPHAPTKEAIALLLAQPAAWERMLDADDRAAMRQALDDRALGHLLGRPTVAIVGVPNVGKSTLANQLFARDHSITADLPGTTRDWVGEQANLDGLVVTLIDTPGIRETDDPIEREAIRGARSILSRAEAIVHVLDVTQPLAAQAALCPEAAIVVLNKIDRPPVWDLAGHAGAIGVCARSGDGVETLRAAIRAHFGCHDLLADVARAWTDRQRHLLQRRLGLR